MNILTAVTDWWRPLQTRTKRIVVALGLLGSLCSIGGFLLAMAMLPRPRISCEVLTNRAVWEGEVSGEVLDDFTTGWLKLEEGQTVSLLTLRFVNDGNVAFRPSDFAPDAPLGFRVPGTVICAWRYSDTNSEYLHRHIGMRGPYRGSSAVSEAEREKDGVVSIEEYVSSLRFRPVVWNPGDYITVSCFVVHQRDARPMVESIGRVASVDAIPVRNLGREKELSAVPFLFAALVLALVACLFLCVLWRRSVRRLKALEALAGAETVGNSSDNSGGEL